MKALQVNAGASKKIELQLPLPELLGAKNAASKVDLYKLAGDCVRSFETDDQINGVSLCPPGTKHPKAHFHVKTDYFIWTLLYDILDSTEKSYLPEKLFPPHDDRTVVEYSSPNIAKPFHVGHMRSTIIGNFIANLSRSVGCKVTRLNYLGDWGTQFGLMQIGLEEGWYSRQQIAQNPISTLLQIYIKANQLAEKDESISSRARSLFHRLENGDEELLRDWSTIRQYTVDELNRMYSRLGVEFDEIHWESMYGIKEIGDVIEDLQRTGKLVTNADGKRVVRLNDKQSITLIKSDGLVGV